MATKPTPKCHFVPELPNGSPIFPKLGLLQLWGPITLCENLRSKWSLKQNCNLCGDLSNDMWHVTCTQGSQGDSWLLMVGSQIGNLTPDPSFGHNLCFNHPNESCEPILNTFMFQEFFNDIKNFWTQWVWPMRYFKIQESIGTTTPKMGVHLKVWRYSLTFSFTLMNMKCDYWASLLARTLALVVSPRLRLWQK
jgi:hypothetical protein